MSQDAIIDLTYTQSNVTDTISFPMISLSAKLNADTSWPELVDSFVQFLRGAGFYIDREWVPQYKEHKELYDKAKDLYREWEASRLAAGEDEVGHNIIISRRDVAPRPVRLKAKKKKKAKK